MSHPKKISPDNLKDAIVEVRYLSILPFEVLIGFIYNALDDTYNYTNQNKNIPNQQLKGNNLPNEITFNIGGVNLFYNDKIKIQLQNGAIIFNFLNNYIGWEEYKIEIAKVLNQISKIKEIVSYSRIGLRYISEYPNADLQNITKYSFTFGIPVVKSNSFIFKTEFNVDKLKVILTLQSKIIVSESPSNNVSVIDIDTINDGLDIKIVSELIDEIDKIHLNEKEIFFNLLKSEFINTLNPIY